MWSQSNSDLLFFPHLTFCVTILIWYLYVKVIPCVVSSHISILTRCWSKWVFPKWPPPSIFLYMQPILEHSNAFIPNSPFPTSKAWLGLSCKVPLLLLSIPQDQWKAYFFFLFIYYQWGQFTSAAKKHEHMTWSCWTTVSITGAGRGPTQGHSCASLILHIWIQNGDMKLTIERMCLRTEPRNREAQSRGWQRASGKVERRELRWCFSNCWFKPLCPWIY